MVYKQKRKGNPAYTNNKSADSFLDTIDNNIGDYLKRVFIEQRHIVLDKHGFVTSPVGSGAWLSVLLPFSIIKGALVYDTSANYVVASCVCAGLLLHSLFVMARKYYSTSIDLILPFQVCLCWATSVVCLYLFTDEGYIMSAFYGIGSIYVYDTSVLLLMRLFPKCFSYGEATIVCQGFVLFVFTFFYEEQNSPENRYSISTRFIQYGIYGLLFLAGIAQNVELRGKPLGFFGALTIIVVLILARLYYLIGENPLMWILTLFTKDAVTVWMVSFWVACSVLAFGFMWMTMRVSYDGDLKTYEERLFKVMKARTMMRKVFHVLLLLVFVPGIILQPCIIYLSSGVAFGLLIMLEMIRKLSIPPWSSFIHDGYGHFVDEKDAGDLVLSPLYLMVGCSLPLWIHPDLDKGDLLPLFAGLLSIGVGDSAASICGTLIGKNRWRGSQKTKEGTAACFLSQLFLVIFLIHIGYVPRNSLIKPIFAIATSSIVEAKTHQVDNIVLPLIMYAIML